MPEITEAELKKQIKTRAFARVYLLYGEETYLTRFYAEKLAERAVTDLPELNLHRFEGGAPAEEIAGACEVLPVLGDFSCVQVCDYPFDKSKSAAETARLRELLADPPEGCVLVFWYDRAEFAAKSAEGREAEKLIRKSGCVVKLGRREERELIPLLEKRAARQGCSLHPTTARYLLSLCGTDLANVLSELDKLCVYVGGGAVTEQDIDAVAVKTVDASAYQLARAVQSNDGDRAFRLIDELFARLRKREDVIPAFSALASAYVDMYRAKAALAAGMRPEDAAEELGYGRLAFRLKNGAAAARRVDVSTLRECLATLRRADLMLKSTSVDGRIILEQTVARLMALCAGQSGSR